VVKIRSSRVRGWSRRPPSQQLLVPLLTTIVVIWALAGCASDNSGRTVPTGHATPTASPSVPTATVVCPYCSPPLSLAQAWGHPTVRTLPTAMDADRTHVFTFDNAATPDNQWLIGAIEPRDFINNTTELSHAVLYNVTTRRIVTMHALMHPQSQILAASADDTWVVWSEADDQPNFFDWTLFAYNRHTGQVRQLTQAARAGGQPVAGPAPYPVVSAGYVIWGQAIGSVGPSTLDNAVVRMEDLATGQVRTLATRAGIPDLSWPWALWGQFSSTAGSSGTGAIVITNLSTGQTEQLAQQPASISMADTSLAWDDTTSVYLLDDFTKGTNTSTQLAYASNPGDHLQFVTLNDRIVAWTSDSETQVYDRAEHRLVTLPVSSGRGVTWVGGHILLWMNPEPQSQQDYDTSHQLIPTPTLNIIDTSALPVQTGQ